MLEFPSSCLDASASAGTGPGTGAAAPLPPLSAPPTLDRNVSTASTSESAQVPTLPPPTDRAAAASRLKRVALEFLSSIPLEYELVLQRERERGVGGHADGDGDVAPAAASDAGPAADAADNDAPAPDPSKSLSGARLKGDPTTQPVCLRDAGVDRARTTLNGGKSGKENRIFFSWERGFPTMTLSVIRTNDVVKRARRIDALLEPGLASHDQQLGRVGASYAGLVDEAWAALGAEAAAGTDDAGAASVPGAGQAPAASNEDATVPDLASANADEGNPSTAAASTGPDMDGAASDPGSDRAAPIAPGSAPSSPPAVPRSATKSAVANGNVASPLTTRPSAPPSDKDDLAWDEGYAPGRVDDPRIRQGRHRIEQHLAGLRLSIVPYTRTKDLKAGLNAAFREAHPDLPRDLTLSMIRKVKREMFDAGVRAEVELSSVALAYVFFEKLVLKGVVGKTNRKLVAATCLVLAVKFNEGSASSAALVRGWTGSPWAALFEPKEVFKVEFSVFAHLRFNLLVRGRDAAEHFVSLLGTLDKSAAEYLGFGATPDAARAVALIMEDFVETEPPGKARAARKQRAASSESGDSGHRASGASRDEEREHHHDHHDHSAGEA